MKRIISIVLLGATICIVPACHEQKYVNYTIFQDHVKKSAALDSTKMRKSITDITVLYGTDRKRLTSKSGIIAYDNVPANPGSPKYEVGYTTVSIPPNHKEGQIETKSWWKFWRRPDTTKEIVEKDITPLSKETFNTMLANAKDGEDAFVFVHGYNNSFEDAALRTAQLAYDIHLPIAPFMFSWSSNHKTGAYFNDADKVKLAVPAFISFLKEVRKNGHYKKIHLIAHSMGNRLISYAFQQLSNDTTNLNIDQVIMAAPDVYADEFKLSLAEPMGKRAHHVTIYSAKNDDALIASKTFNGDFRLGEISVPPPIYVFNNFDIIDATSQKLDWLGHDRFARSPMILADIDMILQTDRDAKQRKVKSKPYGTYIYYYFQ